ncbi:MAG: TRIC cation channel family protein, partial [Planctomycetales bacterium]
GIGGGTLRDLLLGRSVWWTKDPTELVLCMTASLATYFLVTSDAGRRRGLIWADALGLAAFSVVGCHVALHFGSPFVIAVFMGTITATGGGVIRDVLTNTRPMILSGQPYATVALLGSLGYAGMRSWGLPEFSAEAIALAAAFSLRALAIIYDVRMGPPDEFLRWGDGQSDADPQDATPQEKKNARID